MNRFPRVGDFIRFKSYYSANIRDMFAQNNNFVGFNAGDLYQILGIQIHNQNTRPGYSMNTMDVVPFSILVGVHDKVNKPIIIEMTYENIDGGILEFIPGDNPKAVETLYGR